MANLTQKLVDFYNSPVGRKLVNWGITSFGALIYSGVIPLEMPIGPFTLGQLITILGLRLPSHGVQGPVEVAPSIKGT